MKEAKKIKPRKQHKPTRSIIKKKQKRDGWPEKLRWAEPSSREAEDDKEES